MNEDDIPPKSVPSCVVPEAAIFVFCATEPDNLERFAPNVEFKRKPYHICAWKGTLSKKFNFPSSNYGEDVGWLYQLWEVAKTEYYIDKVLHSYIHSNNTSEANVATRLNNQI